MGSAQHLAALHLRRLELGIDLPAQPEGRLQRNRPQLVNPLSEGPQQQGAARGNHGSHRVRQRPTDQSAESELARTDIPVAERVVGE